MGCTYGIMTGFASPIIVLLTSEHSPLPSGKISENEASWIPSLKALGALIGFAFFGMVARQFGRKWPFIFLSFPLIVRLKCQLGEYYTLLNTKIYLIFRLAGF